MSTRVRPYLISDRDAVRRLCCETGFSGEKVDTLFTDRELFADVLTRYYTDWEPENSFVIDNNGKVVGYLLGCCRFQRHTYAQILINALYVIPPALWRLITLSYDAQDRAFLKWICFKSNKETPKAPKEAAHFHFNMLAEYRQSGYGFRLVKAFLTKAKKQGMKQVYGRIQTFDDRRTERAFNRYGFYTFDKCEITKFKHFRRDKVYLNTYVCDLTKKDGVQRLLSDADPIDTVDADTTE